MFIDAIERICGVNTPSDGFTIKDNRTGEEIYVSSSSDLFDFAKNKIENEPKKGVFESLLGCFLPG